VPGWMLSIEVRKAYLRKKTNQRAQQETKIRRNGITVRFAKTTLLEGERRKKGTANSVTTGPGGVKKKKIEKKKYGKHILQGSRKRIKLNDHYSPRERRGKRGLDYHYKSDHLLSRTEREL